MNQLKLLGLATLALSIFPAAAETVAPTTGDGSKTIYLPSTPTYDGARIIPLSTLQLDNITNGWGTIKANKSIDGNNMMMKGYRYTSGVGLHATAKVVVRLNGTTPKFHAALGVDDEVKEAAQRNPSVTKMTYRVVLRKLGGIDEEVLSGSLHANDADVVNIDLDNLTPYKYLIIEVDSDGSNESDHFDLGNAYFEFIYQNSSEPEIVNERELTAGLDAATTVFSQPGVRFMHKLRAHSQESVISVSNLPAGLSYNEKRRLVEGTVTTEGVYTYNVTVTNGEEEIHVPVTLTVSSDLQQPTPFMGWLSWNSIEDKISEDVIKSVADQMERTGLIDAGYKYLVIDDLWHYGGRHGNNATHRTPDGSPIEDPEKFPNGMKACADYVHSKGMKFGIYSDAAANTCAGAFGSLGYETQDANQYAKWDVDLLKYDYCGAPGDTETAKERYTAMGNALKACGRDIIFYICEWGQRDPWKWGAEAGGTCWRTSYDTRDAWAGQISQNGVGVVNSIEALKNIWHYNGVNRWNDADMMMIGLHGTGKSSGELCVGTPGMTQDEYRTQFSLWCLWSSPLTLSNDMSKPLSDDDLAIVTNAELLAVDQDRMGQAAETVYHDADDCLMLAKDCENGDIIVSVTNLTDAGKNYTLDLSKVGAADPGATYFCRDIVNHRDMPKVSGTVDFGYVPTHATVVYRLSLNAPSQSGINDVVEPKALDNIAVTTSANSVNVSLPGTSGTDKRMLPSDLGGRVVADAEVLL